MNPRIGPKVSTNVPDHVVDNIDEYARAIESDRATVIRETLTHLFGERRYGRTESPHRLD